MDWLEAGKLGLDKIIWLTHCCTQLGDTSCILYLSLVLATDEK